MHDDVKRRVEKLLRQAASVAGSPEAEAFTDKAMTLIAEYGITEVDRQMSEVDGSRTIIREEMNFKGNMSAGLVAVMHRIGKALHCAVLPLVAKDRRSGICELYGVAIHVERAMLLMQYLRPQIRASLQQDLNGYSGPLDFESFAEVWHEGFARRIAQRLAELEAEAVVENARDVPKMELVLVSDIDRATQVLFDVRGDVIRFADSARWINELTDEHESPFLRGMFAGDRADIMQTRIES